MQDIYVLCCMNTEAIHKPAVKMIQESEGTDFNHIAILMKDEFGNDWVYEAVFPRARKIPYYEWEKKFKIIHKFKLNLTEGQFSTFYCEMIELIGNVYSVSQCVLIGLANAIGIKWVERKIESMTWNGKNAVICTEFFARPFSYATGYIFENDLDTVGTDEVLKCLIEKAERIGV